MTGREPPPDRSWIEFEYRREVPNVMALVMGAYCIAACVVALALLASLP